MLQKWQGGGGITPLAITFLADAMIPYLNASGNLILYQHSEQNKIIDRIC